jgi:hypothetical protein
MYPNHTHELQVCAHSVRPPGRTRWFPAELSWDDDQPLHPGQRAVVTITVPDEEAMAFLDAGQRFSLWCGSNVGAGVISRRVFSEYVPS